MTALAAFIVFAALLGVAAFEDLRRMEIPDWISIALALAFPVFALAGGASFSSVGAGFGLGIVAFAAGAVLFSFGLLGGGDVKVLAAAAAWFGWGAVAAYFYDVALAGGLFAGALVLMRRLPASVRGGPLGRNPMMRHVLSRESGAPYAVAIAVGAILAAPHASIFRAVFRAH